MSHATIRRRVKSQEPAERNAVIRPGEMLRLRDFLSRTGQGRHAWATAQKAARAIGIQLAFGHGRQLFVSTDAWISYLTHPSRSAVTE